MAVAVCAATGAAGTVGFEYIRWHGWPGCVRLHNPSAELVIVPATGRIMHFAPTGGPNMLWVNPALLGSLPPRPEERKEWANCGGDKLWPAPQARWGWPPDPYLDGSPWKIGVMPDHSVRMESPTSPTTGLRFVRYVTLDATRAEVTIRNVLHNDGQAPVEWSIWEVAQVDDPDWVAIPKESGSRFADGLYVFPDNPVPPSVLEITRDRIVAHRHASQAYKIGGDPRKTEVWCVKGGWSFLIAGPGRAAGRYPDEGCSVEVFSNPDPLAYMEMELLGPVRKIEAGKSIEYRTKWSLKRLQQRTPTR
jgi:hypothetical protein